MKKLIILFVLVGPMIGVAQSNLQSYTPSILFDKGDWEFKSFQNLYRQSKSFAPNGGKSSDGFDQYFFTSVNQFLFGLNDQINIGFDAWIKSSDRDFDAFSPSTGLTGIGPKIKIAPFKKLPRLSIQSTFLINTVQNPEGSEGNRYFLEWDGNLWLNQLYFDLPLNDQYQLFFQQAFWYRMVKDGSSVDNNFLETQTSVFFSYFPNSRWTIYGMSEYFPRHYDLNNERAEAFFSYFVQSGLGLKYQLIPNLIEMEALYTNFWNGSEGQGAGETINLGIRVIHQ